MMMLSLPLCRVSLHIEGQRSYCEGPEEAIPLKQKLLEGTCDNDELSETYCRFHLSDHHPHMYVSL